MRQVPCAWESGAFNKGNMMFNTISYKYNIYERVTKAGDKVFDISFRFIDYSGKVVQKQKRGFKTKKEARDFYTDFMTDQIVAPVKAPKSVLPYDEARSVYFSAIKQSVKESTLYDFTKVGKNYLDVFWGGKNLYTCGRQDFVDFKLWLATMKRNGQALSPTTQNKIYRQFSAFYNWCVEQYAVPPISVPAPKKAKKQRDMCVWSQDEFDRFIAVVDDDRFVAVFSTLFYCGLRCGELQALSIKDFDGKQLYVHNTYTRKTLDGTPFKITETKNYKARRVPVPAPLLPVLLSWCKKNKGNAFLFGKTSPLHSSTIQNAFDRYIALSGVPKIRIHDLRHSYVSLLLSKGANISVVAKLIGDTQEQVVKTYAHAFDKDIDNIIASIF